MKRFGITLISAAIMAVSFSGSASALPEFKKAFQEKYTDKEANPEFYDVVKKAGCNVCHIKGEDKDKRNAYGDELAKLIEGDAGQRKKDVKDESKEKKDEVKAEILAELEKAWDVAAEKENADGVKFGDLIKESKLPVPLPSADK